MRPALFLVIRILMSVGLLYLSLRNIHFDALRARLTDFGFGWFALALLATLLQVVLSALRWCEVAKRCGAPLESGRAIKFNMIGTFFNQTLPSSIGGDAMRLWLFGHIAGWREATYSVLVERAIGLIALAIIIVGSLPWSYPLITSPKGQAALVIIGAAALASSLGFLLIGSLSWPWLKHWWPLRHVHACGEVANKVLFNTRSGPKVVALSLAIHMLAVAAAWCCVMAIHASASFMQIFLLIPPIMLITMLPISIAGWGVREASMTVAFGYAGLMTAEGTVVSILFGIVTFIAGAIGGLIWISSPEKRGKAAAVVPRLD
jgi:uncharacterized membrane protein YbhN (UPF0104 family)